MSSNDFSGNYLLGLNPQQLSIVSQYINDKFVCPISFETLNNPFISPCGHTFDYPNIYQVLENKKICPLDRGALSVDVLVKNKFVKKLVEATVMVIFLSFGRRFGFRHSCCLSGKPLFEAVKLPCGHIFDKSTITEFYKKRKCCPIDNKEFDISDMIYDPDTSKLAQDQYPKYLEEVKLFNLTLSSKVAELQLDDRNLLMRKLFQVSTCPISKNIIETPVIAPCGHTFDLSSIKDGASCPHDLSKLSKDQVFPNRIARDLLECLGSKLFKEANAKTVLDKDGQTGVFLFLKPNTTLYRIREIAISLGIIKPPGPRSEQRRFYVHGEQYDNEEKLSQIKLLNETSDGIPVLYIW